MLGFWLTKPPLKRSKSGQYFQHGSRRGQAKPETVKFQSKKCEGSRVLALRGIISKL